MGRYVLAEDYVRAMQLRELLRRASTGRSKTCDALLLPTLPMAAPPLGAATVDVGGRREPVRAAMLRLTQLFNITGHPALALPAGLGRDGLPRSLQLVGSDAEAPGCSTASVASAVNRRSPAEPEPPRHGEGVAIGGGPGSVGGGTGECPDRREMSGSLGGTVGFTGGGMLDDVGRLRHVGHRRLFNHAHWTCNMLA